MIFFRICSLQLLLFASFLLGTLQEEGVAVEEKNCFDNNLSPMDEDPNPNDYDDSTSMAVFLKRLEYYTGLNGEEEKFSVTLENCGGIKCVINPNGTAIWDARMDLYRSNLMDETHQKTTLDGCLCYSNNIADYRNCMSDVRSNMIKQLDTILQQKFKTIVESDCNSFAANCVIK